MPRLLIAVLALLLFGAILSNRAHALTLRAPETFERQDTNAWYVLETKMIKTNDKEITIYWQGIGGYIDKAEDFIDVVKQVQRDGKKVYLIIDGEAVSCHAVVACYVNGYKFKGRMSDLVFHNATDHHLYDDSETRRVTRDCVDKGIITSQEIEQIIENRQRLVIGSDGSRVFKPDYPEEEM